ncbi:hypothetical protein CsSME_00037581 [Camellia sinensis var. sinensis]
MGRSKGVGVQRRWSNLMVVVYGRGFGWGRVRFKMGWGIGFGFGKIGSVVRCPWQRLGRSGCFGLGVGPTSGPVGLLVWTAGCGNNGSFVGSLPGGVSDLSGSVLGVLFSWGGVRVGKRRRKASYGAV